MRPSDGRTKALPWNGKCRRINSKWNCFAIPFFLLNKSDSAFLRYRDLYNWILCIFVNKYGYNSILLVEFVECDCKITIFLIQYWTHIRAYLFFILAMTKKFLRIIFWLSLVTMLGSLYVEYYGDPFANLISGNLRDSSLGILACNLCWYIRIFSYPTVFISAIGLYTNDKNVAYSIASLSVIAILFCIYKYGLERLWWESTKSFLCMAGTATCSEAKPLYFGFISLSFMGAIINSIIIWCCLKVLKNSQ